MKIAIFSGSPRKNGNSAFLATLLSEKINNADVSFHYLMNYKINPCIDCRLCKKGELICPVKDDMQELYQSLEAADLLVFATPIYWFTPTGIMKNFIDRFRPYFANKKLAHKNAAVILTAGSGKGDCDLTAEMFKRVFHALQIPCLGIVMSEAFDLHDAEKNQESLAETEKLAHRINLI
jgi:multimeric flavodoxin WrbA